MVFGELISVLFQHIRAFLVFSQLKEVLGEEKNGLECWFGSPDVDVILFVGVSVAGDETLDKKRLLYVAFGGDAEEQLADPESMNGYHLAEWVRECAVR